MTDHLVPVLGGPFHGMWWEPGEVEEHIGAYRMNAWCDHDNDGTWTRNQHWKVTEGKSWKEDAVEQAYLRGEGMAMPTMIPVIGGDHDGQWWPDAEELSCKGVYLRDTWPALNPQLPNWKVKADYADYNRVLAVYEKRGKAVTMIPVCGGPYHGDWWPDGARLDIKGDYVRDAWNGDDDVLPHWSHVDWVADMRHAREAWAEGPPNGVRLACPFCKCSENIESTEDVVTCWECGLSAPDAVWSALFTQRAAERPF